MNSDIMEMGTAHELILAMIKCCEPVDDAEPMTVTPEEDFEQ